LLHLLYVEPRGNGRLASKGDYCNAFSAFGDLVSAFCLQLVTHQHQISFRLFCSIKQRDLGFCAVQLYRFTVVTDMYMNAFWLGNNYTKY
jgi:hypothetical protein